MDPQLRPTIWRTCRVLANLSRLKLLRILGEVGAGTVSQLAVLARMPERLTGQYLRMLQARGLLTAEQVGRYVSYRPQANPAIPEAQGILRALRMAMVAPEQKKVMATLTAFTHPRRITLVGVLRRGPASLSDLRRKADISERALGRHLDKLERRGIVGRRDDGEAQWRLLPQTDPLAKALVQCCTWLAATPRSGHRSRRIPRRVH